MLPTNSSRRDFIRTAGVAGLVASAPVARSAHAGGSDTIKAGLVGCGGRGTGAAAQCLNADPGVRLVAMADVFEDRLFASRERLQQGNPEKVDVPEERCFAGFDGYRKLIDEVDLVILATPPHFRPMHIEAAVSANKHIFAEKPVAVDAPGVRSVLASCDLAKKKGLAVVSGLCWRYHSGVQQTIQRIQDGAIGRLVAMQTNYNTGTLWMKPRQPQWSDMEWQLRNWLYFAWLSGDHNVEQHIHSLDKTAWVLGDEYPTSAVGLGGRQVRIEKEFGHIYDHHAVVYETANGVRIYSFCRQMAGCHNDVSDQILGTEGMADILKYSVTGKTNWKATRPRSSEQKRTWNMYQNEHDEMIASIRAAKPINNGEYMCKSTMMAIMGRMATYTGQKITWDAAINSKQDLSPQKYEFGPLPMPEVARPGITAFI